MNHGELRGFSLAHQRAFGHQRAPDAAGNRGGDAGVIQVDASGLYGRLANGYIGLGLLLGGLGAHKLLLADGFGFCQWLVALGLCAGLHQVGLGFSQAGFGTGKGGLVGAGVNLKQGLACLHITAFREQPLLQNAGRPRPDLGHAGGFQAAGQLGDQAHIGQRYSNDAHLRRRHTRPGSNRSSLFFSAARQNGSQCQSAHGQ